MSKYLDYEGLLYFKQKLDGLFETKEVVASKIANPTTKSQGQILTYNGTNWVAQDAPDTGVVSFNGREGVVVPTSGDYSAAMISFNDTIAQLNKTNVQEAIETIDSSVDVLNAQDAKIKAVSGIIKGNGSGNYSAAVAGSDYQLPLTAGVDYQVPVAFADGYDASTNKAATVKP